MKELTIDDVKEGWLAAPSLNDLKPIILRVKPSRRVLQRIVRTTVAGRRGRALKMLSVANVVNELQSSYGPYLLGDAALHKLNFLKGRGPRKNPRYVASCESPKSSKLSASSKRSEVTLKWSTKKGWKFSSKPSRKKAKKKPLKSSSARQTERWIEPYFDQKDPVNP